MTAPDARLHRETPGVPAPGAGATASVTVPDMLSTMRAGSNRRPAACAPRERQAPRRGRRSFAASLPGALRGPRCARRAPLVTPGLRESTTCRIASRGTSRLTSLRMMTASVSCATHRTGIPTRSPPGQERAGRPRARPAASSPRGTTLVRTLQYATGVGPTCCHDRVSPRGRVKAKPPPRRGRPRGSPWPGFDMPQNHLPNPPRTILDRCSYRYDKAKS